MENENIERLKYPIGKFESPVNIDSETINKWISEIEELPSKIRNAVKGLTEDQETQKPVVLKKNIGVYAWHGKHHTAHITNLRERMNW